ncbi:MAG: helix-turn-helix transcriptional regulator [Clostridia bacterium]|nr:helix-turn-helix transcriptional regulator [Clostridia bacterium]
MTIADRIRNRRVELGLSVDDLANLLQKNRATVYRYESNYIKSYSPDVLESLAKALQTTPAYFYGYDEENEGSEIDPEIHIVSGMMETMTKEQKQQVIDLVRILMKK